MQSLDNLAEIAAAERLAIGIIATPAAVAQDVADRLVEAGVTSILNFAPAIINVPRGVSQRKVDLWRAASIELSIGPEATDPLVQAGIHTVLASLRVEIPSASARVSCAASCTCRSPSTDAAAASRRRARGEIDAQ